MILRDVGSHFVVARALLVLVAVAITHTTPPHPSPPYLPAGDAWIVYPGRDGPLDSIRHEAMRDGIADYELLSMLGERNPPAAERLVAKHVLDFDRHDCDVKTFRATRRKLLELLSGR